MICRTWSKISSFWAPPHSYSSIPSSFRTTNHFECYDCLHQSTFNAFKYIGGSNCSALKHKNFIMLASWQPPTCFTSKSRILLEDTETSVTGRGRNIKWKAIKRHGLYAFWSSLAGLSFSPRVKNVLWKTVPANVVCNMCLYMTRRQLWLGNWEGLFCTSKSDNNQVLHMYNGIGLYICTR